jgi:imidazolonepropionase-like amidohydrolase
VAEVPANTEELDVEGKHVYPGLIACNTRLGLSEIDMARPTLDFSETGTINPNVRALVAYNTDSRIIPTVRSNGVLLAQIAPQGGVLAGRSSIVQLDAWNWEDAAISMDDGVFVNWPDMSLHGIPDTQSYDDRRIEVRKALEDLDRMMVDARAYKAVRDGAGAGGVDQRWEALMPVLTRQKPLYVRLQTAAQIHAAVAFARRYDIRLVLVGARDAGRVGELLRAHSIPVILTDLHSLPLREDESVDEVYSLPRKLREAKVQFCLSVEGAWEQRNLMFQAGTAAAYGLTREEALSTVTLECARILGIDSRAGSLEAGKDATLVVSSGDLLDMRSSAVEQAFINGRRISLGNRHKDLYEKFKSKYQATDP